MEVPKITTEEEQTVLAHDESQRDIRKYFESGHEILDAVPVQTRQKIRVVFVFAHPDDEASHLATIELLETLGFQVSIEWLTNGDGSTKADVKKLESLRVLKDIRVSKHHFFDHSVRELIRDVFRSSTEIRDQRLETLLQEVRERIQSADIIVTNAFEGGHILHDLTNLLVRSAVDEGQTVLEVPQYSLKTIKELIKSFFRACVNRCLRKRVFYNVGSFREGKVEKLIGVKTREAGSIAFPGKLVINSGGETLKASQLTNYQSQWKNVFAPFLDAVEFNGTASLELFRKAGPIQKMWRSIMHLEKWILSKFSGVISPKKIYEVMEKLEEIRERARFAEIQAATDLELPERSPVEHLPEATCDVSPTIESFSESSQ
jgi:LmbE family N-acetylglucosaminyl deacetylase